MIDWMSEDEYQSTITKGKTGAGEGIYTIIESPPSRLTAPLVVSESRRPSSGTHLDQPRSERNFNRLWSREGVMRHQLIHQLVD